MPSGHAFLLYPVKKKLHGACTFHEEEGAAFASAPGARVPIGKTLCFVFESAAAQWQTA